MAQAFVLEKEREEAHATLGCEEGADADAVKKAHRKLIIKYHPDKAGEEGRDMFDKVTRRGRHCRVLPTALNCPRLVSTVSHRDSRYKTERTGRNDSTALA